jgi:hypothetical protein
VLTTPTITASLEFTPWHASPVHVNAVMCP